MEFLIFSFRLTTEQFLYNIDKHQELPLLVAGNINESFEVTNG